jgi:hypothetical protein
VNGKREPREEEPPVPGRPITHTGDKLSRALADPTVAERSVEALAEAWRAARDDAEDAYAWWLRAADEERADARSVYVAASDREAAAALTYARAFDGAIARA